MEVSRTRTILIGICVATSCIDWGIIFSVQPAFYPQEAEKHGATPSQYGFVFGIVHLAAFLSAPVFAKYGNRIGPKLLYNTGALVQGVQAICFGFLVYAENTAVFLGLSYLLRMVDGIADAAAWGAILSILMKIWPDKVATIMSWTELCFGLGYAIGPAIGSYLYELGGFMLPFEVTGGFGLLVGVLIFFVIPNVQQDAETQDESNDGDGSKLKLTLSTVFKSPSLFMPYVDNAVTFIGYGYVEALIQPHLIDAGASQTQVAYFFLIIGALYMVTTPCIGYACDRMTYPIIISIIGNALMAVVFVFVGPLPVLSFGTSLELLYGMAALIGFSYTFTMVSTFSRAHSEAMRQGYEDDLQSYIILSGLWSTSFYFGNFIGPTLGGFLVEYFSFAGATYIYLGLYIFMFFVDGIEFLSTQRRVRKSKAYVESKILVNTFNTTKC
eukprot:snap_masked-scaffold1863_size26100-processed-gene-0.1 protein:Tk10457 transcript:snap_masked-scaffold1863_size26100-processed-gene-0.1-mRNA-1 annotation:"chromaffin granule amine"